MKDDVRIAALRAASKLALGVTFLGGIGCAATADDGDTSPEADTADELKGSKKHVKADAGAKDAACHEDAAPAASCKEVLASTFADPAWNDFRTYRWKTDDGKKLPATTADVKSCCLEALEPGDGGTTDWSHRWECCNLLGNGTSTGEGAPMACTPWGPPVPPSMTRRARRLSAEGVA